MPLNSNLPMKTEKGFIWISAGLLFFGLLLGCESEVRLSGEPSGNRIEAPAGSGSAQPRLYSKEDGSIWLSWLEPSGEGHALRYAFSDGIGWSEPNTVASGTDWFVNWADLPSVRPLPDGRLAAHYLESNGASALAYGVRLLQTTGNGTWHDPVAPHRDGTPTEHGFVSLVPWSDGRLLAVWLDGRKRAEEGGRGGGMTLRSATLGSTGAIEHRSVIDGRTCECCATSAVRVGDEALLAYRDRSEEEVRNIRVTRFDGEGWSTPTLVHNDGWKIEGCPVNGPALAADGDRVVVAWFTAADATPRVRVAFSGNGGRAFGEPIQVASAGAKGRVDAVFLDDGSAVVSWLSKNGKGTLRARRIHPGQDATSSVSVVDLPSAGRSVGFPKMIRRNDALYFAWVGPSDDVDTHTVRMAQMPVGAVQEGPSVE